MNRKNFLRNIALSIAISLLPRVLQPIMSQIEEEMIDVQVVWTTYVMNDKHEMVKVNIDTPNTTIQLSRKEYETISKHLQA